MNTSGSSPAKNKDKLPIAASEVPKGYGFITALNVYLICAVVALALFGCLSCVFGEFVNNLDALLTEPKFECFIQVSPLTIVAVILLVAIFVGLARLLPKPTPSTTKKLLMGAGFALCTLSLFYTLVDSSARCLFLLFLFASGVFLGIACLHAFFKKLTGAPEDSKASYDEAPFQHTFQLIALISLFLALFSITGILPEKVMG